MDRTLNIEGGDHELECFLANWFDDSPYITAHTSGSTGIPKEIWLKKSDMVASAKATCDFFRITERSTLYLPLSVSYIAGKMMVVRSLVSGARLCMEQPSNRPMQSFFDRVTLMAVVPSQLPSLIHNPNLSQVDNIIVGGAPVSSDIERDLAYVVPHVYATYGMTETCSHVALRDISAGSDLYRALPDINFSVDDRCCLVIQCPIMSIAQVHTNDVVELQSPTAFRWLGRYDNVVNSGGIKLHPEILERKLSSVIRCPFYLVGRESVRWGQELVMVVCGKVDIQDLMDKASTVLNPYEMPKDILMVREFPKAANGKIRRILPTVQ